MSRTPVPPPHRRPSGTPARSVPDHVAYGGFWIRVVAYIIDGILLTIVCGVVAQVARHRYLRIRLGSLRSDGQRASPLVIGWLYFALLESSASQATLGKMAMGIKVTDLYGRGSRSAGRRAATSQRSSPRSSS